MDVMIVDDEILVRVGIKSMIRWEEYGFRIVGEASNGYEALKLIEACQPSLIITDMKMPKMDGIGLIRHVKQAYEGIEFIILSCFNEFELVKEAMKLGASDYLIKSDIDTQQLLAILIESKQKLEKQSALKKQERDISLDLNKSRELMKETFLKELISGFILSEDYINSQISKLKMNLLPNNLVIIKIKLDHFSVIKEKYIEKDEQLLRFSILNIVKEVSPKRLCYEIIVDRSDEYVIFMNLIERSDIEGLKSLCTKIKEALKDFINISISVGVSSPFDGWNQIYKAYKEANQAVKARFFQGSGSLVFYHTLQKHDQQHASAKSGMSLTEQFKARLEQMNREGLNQSLTQLYNSLKDANEEELARRTYSHIIQLLMTMIKGIASEADEIGIFYAELLSMETLDGIHAYTLSKIDEYFRAASNKSYVEKAMEYMLENYHGDISLISVSNRINVNPSYLSRLFKQETGEGFTNYLTKVRIEKAKYYLNLKKYKVYEVAEKVGYQNIAYFSKLFKTITGVSPDQYPK